MFVDFFQLVLLLDHGHLATHLISKFSMSQKQKFHHNNNKPTPPEEGWTPAYANLQSGYFKYIVQALQEGRILATDEPAEVYNKNPYLWRINPYKFTHFFNKAITLMSTLSHDDYTLLLSLPSASRTNPSTQSSLPDTIFGNNREQSPSPPSPSPITSSSSPSPSGPPPHQLSLHLLNLSLQK